MTTPQRVQLRRTKGWRKPGGAIVVARPSKWGNPFTVGEYGRGEAIRLYRKAVLLGHPGVPTVEEIQQALAGHDLACWCPRQAVPRRRAVRDRKHEPMTWRGPTKPRDPPLGTYTWRVRIRKYWIARRLPCAVVKALPARMVAAASCVAASH